MDIDNISFLMGAAFGAVPLLWLFWCFRDVHKKEIEWEKFKRELEVKAVREYWMESIETMHRNMTNVDK